MEEIQKVIINVEAEQCRTKISMEKTKKGKLLYSPIDLNARFKQSLQQKNWSESRVGYWVTKDAKLIQKTHTMNRDKQKEEIEKAGLKAIYSYNQTDFVKDRGGH